MRNGAEEPLALRDEVTLNPRVVEREVQADREPEQYLAGAVEGRELLRAVRGRSALRAESLTEHPLVEFQAQPNVETASGGRVDSEDVVEVSIREACHVVADRQPRVFVHQHANLGAQRLADAIVMIPSR